MNNSKKYIAVLAFIVILITGCAKEEPVKPVKAAMQVSVDDGTNDGKDHLPPPPPPPPSSTSVEN